MEFFKRFRKPNPSLAKPTIGDDTSGNASFIHKLDRNLIYGAAALLVILVLIFGGRFVHHYWDSHHHKNLTPANTKLLPTNPNGTSQSKPNPNVKPNSNSSSNSSNSTPSTSGSSTASGQIPNTGPGDVAAIFVASAIAAAGLHYVIRLRKNA